MTEIDTTQEFITKSPLEVEPATPEDAAEVFDVQRRTWLDTYPNEEAGITYEDIRVRLEGENGELIPKKVDWWKRGIETAGETRAIFVVRDIGKVVGFVAPSIMNKQRRIGAIYVLPETQGKGVGRKLLEKAVEWHGRDEDIFLHVASYNQNAIDFYKKNGFEETGTKIVDEDALRNGNAPIPETEMVLKAAQ
jgi:ribosomal protein S18 acetylase RimI-like enzyme